MKKLKSSNLQLTVLAAITAAVFIFAAILPSIAQNTSYKTGDRVEVDVNMSTSPENMKWQKATIVEVMMWQGKISGIYVKTDSGPNMTVGERHLRRLNEAEKMPAVNAPANRTGSPDPGAGGPSQTHGDFRVGDRVEVDSIMANESNGAHWVKATVTHVDIKGGRYVVRRDEFNEMTVLIRPGKIWIRPLNDGSAPPAYPSCEFY